MSRIIEETSFTKYKLRAFSSSNDSDFIKALRIYTDNIGATSLTDTNEIVYCLDNYSKHHPKSQFIVAGFYQNKELIGYCQFIYISDNKLVIIDYIAIDEKYRGLNVFYTLIEKIREFVYINGFEAKFVVGEINIQNSQSGELSNKTKSLIKLLKLNNFGEIKSLYYQPMLGVENYESEQKSILMIYPASEYESIKKETFSYIIETIYYKHYERWYKIFLSEHGSIMYSKHLHDLSLKILEKAISPIIIDKDDYIYGEQDLNNEIIIPKNKKGLLLIFGFLGLLFLIVSITLFLRKQFNFEYKDQFYLIIFVAILYLFILSVYSDKAEKVLHKAVEKIINKLT